MQNTMCRKCGSRGFYLQQKGMQVGVYCDTCGAWEKWASKQDQQIYRNRGVKIYSQDMQVEIKGVNHNLGVVVQPISQTQTPSDMGISSQPVSQPQNFGGNQLDIEAEVQRRVQEELSKMGKSVSPQPPSSSPTLINNSLEFDNMGIEDNKEVKKQGKGFCPLCDGNIMQACVDGAKVEVFALDGLMSVTNIGGEEALGFFSLNYCPCCGIMYDK